MNRKLLSALLAFTVVILTACNGTPVPTQQPTQEEVIVSPSEYQPTPIAGIMDCQGGSITTRMEMLEDSFRLTAGCNLNGDPFEPELSMLDNAAIMEIAVAEAMARGANPASCVHFGGNDTITITCKLVTVDDLQTLHDCFMHQCDKLNDYREQYAIPKEFTDCYGNITSDACAYFESSPNGRIDVCDMFPQNFNCVYFGEGHVAAYYSFITEEIEVRLMEYEGDFHIYALPFHEGTQVFQKSFPMEDQDVTDDELFGEPGDVVCFILNNHGSTTYTLKIIRGTELKDMGEYTVNCSTN
jgi:hypothetical protein